MSRKCLGCATETVRMCRYSREQLAQRAVLMGHLDLACIEDGHIEQANTGKGYQYQPLPLNFRFSDSKQVIQFFK